MVKKIFIILFGVGLAISSIYVFNYCIIYFFDYSTPFWVDFILLLFWIKALDKIPFFKNAKIYLGKDKK